MPGIQHMALAVDVDRHTDAYLRWHVCRGLKVNGFEPTPEKLRALCAKARANGQEVFAPCDNTDARGYCQGHEDDSPTGHSTASPVTSSTDHTSAPGRDVGQGKSAKHTGSEVTGGAEHFDEAPAKPVWSQLDHLVTAARDRFGDAVAEYVAGAIGIAWAKGAAAGRK
jgi:hypothetical protein